MFTRRLVAAAAVALAVAGLGLTACGDDDGQAAGAGGTVEVQASFYPLAWIAERVGGEHVAVHSLTKAGAEPHDLELSPSDVADVLDADLVVYLDGFQPAVDDAVGQIDGDRRFDVADAGADLDLRAASDDEVDPHFWLDPTRLAERRRRAVRPPGRARSRPRRGVHRQRAGPAGGARLPRLLVRHRPGRLHQP